MDIDRVFKEHPELGHFHIDARPKVYSNDVENCSISGTIRTDKGYQEFHIRDETVEKAYRRFKSEVLS